MFARQDKTPFWLELLMLVGAVTLVNQLARVAGIGAAPKNRVSDEKAQAEPNRVLPEDGQAGDGQAEDGKKSASEDGDEEGAFKIRPSEEPEHVHAARAKEDNRGRKAPSPFHMPFQGWRDVFWRVVGQIGDDRVLAVAAGVVFYMLLALFPALAAFVSIYGLTASPDTITEHINTIAAVVPEGGLDIIQDQISRLTDSRNASLSFGFLFGLGLALWSANAGIKAVMDALNVVYDEKEKRSFIKLNLISFAFTLGALAFMIAAINAIVILPLVLSWVGFESYAGQLISILRWPALVVIVLVWLALLYRYGPSRASPQWRWLSVGSLFAALAWLGGSALFSWYLSNFANYDATYGSLGAAIGLMMWLWLSIIIILLGAEINAEIEHQTARDTTTRPEKPMGDRGAVMADTVGANAES
ncbi:YihY/virulence factor BrkB family protein [Methyloligella solikamskensis]|uniref:YihY/virulence factor BrkB family protein n=1 Tax=Methyloligella solikamskensis TaxID=1177756 RepID=A0ABW3JC64_9HYPH